MCCRRWSPRAKAPSSIPPRSAPISGRRNLGPYTASKHAVLGLTKSTALEVARKGVRINAVCPGPVDTPMLREIEAGQAGGADESLRAKRAASIPDGRYAEPEEVANLMVYLASDYASHITGPGDTDQRRESWLTRRSLSRPERIGVVGGGTMGVGIVYVFAAAGFCGLVGRARRCARGGGAGASCARPPRPGVKRGKLERSRGAARDLEARAAAMRRPLELPRAVGSRHRDGARAARTQAEGARRRSPRVARR